MTRDEIIRIAVDAQFFATSQITRVHESYICALERFAALVAAAEREACIALRNHEDVQAPVGNSAWGEARRDGWIEGTSAYRDAIRARGEKGGA